MSTSAPDYTTFDQCIRYWAATAPRRTALTDEDRQHDFAALETITAKAAAMLIASGLGKGDRIIWIGKNSDLYAILFFAAARVGIVMVPVGWRLSAEEWIAIVDDTAARRLFVGEGFEDAVRKVAGRFRHVDEIVGHREARDRVERTERCDFAPSTDHDTILQLYTSGTTGKPKGVVLSNHNLFALQIPARQGYPDWMRWDDDEGMLGAMPCAHVAGSGIYVMALAAGAATHILPEFDPGRVLDLVQQGRITRFFLVPAALQLLLQDPRCDAVDFTRVKYILYGAAPMPLALLKQCISVFDARFIQAYGMTETSGAIVMLSPDDHGPEHPQRLRSAGRPLVDVDIRIVDGDGKDLPIGEVGQIVTRSSNNMLGYWNMPGETAATIDADGWLHTGDAGYLDDDGYLYIHDRVKDMIISGGENVYPAEVENAIYGHPAVEEVAVIGVPDAKWGEAVKAICVPRKGMRVNEAAIIEWTRERLAHFKCPRSVEVMEALPRNASGKILRRELRAPFWEGRDRMVN